MFYGNKKKKSAHPLTNIRRKQKDVKKILQMLSCALFGVNRRHFINYSCMLITFEVESDCDWLILSTST